MDLEKTKKQLRPSTRYIISNTDLSEEDVEEMIEIAWSAGYDFRIQEEELNKDASF